MCSRGVGTPKAPTRFGRTVAMSSSLMVLRLLLQCPLQHPFQRHLQHPCQRRLHPPRHRQRPLAAGVLGEMRTHAVVIQEEVARSATLIGARAALLIAIADRLQDSWWYES